MYRKVLLALGSAAVLFGGGCVTNLGQLLSGGGLGTKAVLDLLGINPDSLIGGLLTLG